MTIPEQFFYHLTQRRYRRARYSLPVTWTTPWLGDGNGVHRQFVIATVDD